MATLATIEVTDPHSCFIGVILNGNTDWASLQLPNPLCNNDADTESEDALSSFFVEIYNSLSAESRRPRRVGEAKVGGKLPG